MALGTHILGVQTSFFAVPETGWANISVDGRPVTKNACAHTVEPLGPTARDQIFAGFPFRTGNTRSTDSDGAELPKDESTCMQCSSMLRRTSPG
ncbi:MAG: hypothetical protein JXR94_07010 [Candidatus Hydrogenedentes bacterium]|nr:hypothetical protein [Candidatus Hydrogenedentota bacterium]